MRRVRLVAGLIAWITVGVFLCQWFHGYMVAPRAEGQQVASQLWEFATAERRRVRLRLEDGIFLEVGDPIFRINGPESIEQVGEIRRVDKIAADDPDAAASRVVEALLYPQAPDVHDRTYMTYYTTPRSMTWVMATMLPQEKQDQLEQEILIAYQTYHTEILQAVKPILVGGFSDAIEVVEEDLASALSQHREQLEDLAGRYQSRVVEQEIVPLVRQEIWPIVKNHAEPLANEIGRELYGRASLWRFGWRVLYDKSFLPEKNLTLEEWNRFVREEGLPVLDHYGNDIVDVQRQILEDIARNQKVRSGVRRNLMRVIDDPEFRSIVWQVFRQVLVENPRLRQRLEQRWKTTEAQRALQLATYYIEPCVRRIGDLLFGTRQDGIAPEFAQVLRNQILDKDCRWLVINTPPGSVPIHAHSKEVSLHVQRGEDPEVNPFALQLKDVK